ncbi:hypothetical protein [Glycomyces tenuis]|uniref:hypothetical protein n=1 Tax=Glycomyces tenuis TaxID=58116 RepID=UPI000AD61458|nr:hypothetical protein [Glycomyces tenuis]
MTKPSPPMEKQPRPGAVTFAVVLQLLLAAAMAATAVLTMLYGADAQEAYEAELNAQGVDVDTLPAGSTSFGGGSNLVFPIVVIVILVVLALLNAAGNRVGRILTWVFQPLVLICGGFVFASALFGEQLTQWAFDNSGDETLESLDAGQLLEAAYNAYPGWSVVVDWATVLLTTLGSLLVIILLAVPAANAYFRKEAPPTYIPGAPTQ